MLFNRLPSFALLLLSLLMLMLMLNSMATTMATQHMPTTTMATMLMVMAMLPLMLLPSVMVLELLTPQESVKLRLSHLSSPTSLLPMLLLLMPTTHTTTHMPQLPAATSMLPPPMLPTTSTSFTSVRLSPRELLFTPDLPPHPPSEAHRVQELQSMDTPLSMDMVMDTPPMVMVSMVTTDTSK